VEQVALHLASVGAGRAVRADPDPAA